MAAREIINYLRQPTFTENGNHGKIKNKFKEVIITYLIYLPPFFFSAFLLFLVDKLLVQHFYDYSIFEQLSANRQELKNKYGIYTFLVVVLIGPFLEEIIFRLPLTLKKPAIALSITLLVYRFVGGHFFSFNFQEASGYIRLGIAICTMFIIIKFLPSSWLAALKQKSFNYFFYGSAFVFALMHISNFSPYNYHVYLFYPFYTLPQFVMGLFIGYVRMKHGFISGWSLHSLINLPSVLLG